MELEDTIVAISTPLGQGGLGIIRLSGPQSHVITGKIFKPTNQIIDPFACSHTIIHGLIQDSDKSIDEVLISVFLRPHSYTGEDIIEISAHGGPVILQEILNLCIKHGARLAKPGEFTFRAFMNGRMDLAQAEAVADLIASKTELSSHSSINQLQGGFSLAIKDLRQKLVDMLSHLEVTLDYAEEDIQFLNRSETTKIIENTIKSIQNILKSANKGKLLRDGLKLAIIGRPNVGKSSLLNALLERDRAIVTEVPGTTRDVIEEILDLGGIPCLIMDTAGLKHINTDKVEQIGQVRTYNCIKNADLLLWLLDSSQSISSEDHHIAELLSPLNITEKTMILLNKIDLPSRLTQDDLKTFYPKNIAQLEISALKKSGIDKLEEAIIAWSKSNNTLKEESYLLNTRHIQALKRSESSLNEAIIALNQNDTEELIAFNVRESLNALGEITGETATEEILDNIFSRFCVGK